MLALDTEDDSNGTVSIINFFDGREHTTFQGKDVDKFRKEAWNFLGAIGREHVWACNVEYDLINLFGAAWLGKLCTLCYVSAGLLRASFNPLKDHRVGITFFDTLRHWQISVEGMGEMIDRPKLAQDFQSVEYCRRDTEIVWFFVDEMLKRYEALGLKTKATLPAMALQLFQQFTTVPKYPLPEFILDWLRKSYYGGRVELYRVGPIKGITYHYDFNSLFPSVMRAEQYPDVSKNWRITDEPDFSKEGAAEVTIDVPYTDIPTLPYRADEEVVFPYGTLHGCWTYPEIRQALQDGAIIRTTWQALEFDYTSRPFRTFIDFCYQERLKASTPLDKGFWKLMMNSLYGKFGQKDGLFMIFEDREIDFATRASHANVIWSAYVTAYARLRQLCALRGCSEVYYTDTDSLFTPDEFQTTSGLGDLKLEGTHKLVEFHGSKMYVLDGKAKAKGVKQTVADDFIRTGRAVFRRPARFRESRRSFLVANVWYEVEKKLEATYTKRRILPDSSHTVPWTLKAYLEEMEK